jgi:hypothetical protein
MRESDGSARLHGQAQHPDPGDTRNAIGSGRGDFGAFLESAGDPAGNAGAGEGIPINYYNRSLFFVIIAYTEPAQARGIKGLPHYSAQFLHSGKLGNEFHPR